jgi:hypothetical protein
MMRFLKTLDQYTIHRHFREKLTEIMNQHDENISNIEIQSCGCDFLDEIDARCCAY